MMSASDGAAWTSAEWACSADGGAATMNQSATPPRPARGGRPASSAPSGRRGPAPSTRVRRLRRGRRRAGRRRDRPRPRLAASALPARLRRGRAARRVAPGAPATDPSTVMVIGAPDEDERAGVLRRGQRRGRADLAATRDRDPQLTGGDRLDGPHRAGPDRRRHLDVVRWRCRLLALDRWWRLRRALGGHDVEQLDLRADLQRRQRCLTGIERRPDTTSRVRAAARRRTCQG